MKRHPALEPFSRDHNTGLILARALIEKRPDAGEDLLRAWQSELKDHFREEERLLAPLATRESAFRLRQEHARIADLVARLPASGPALGTALEQHIRWEERQFFPEIQATAPEEALRLLSAETDRLEERRWEHGANRRRLVQLRRLRMR